MSEFIFPINKVFSKDPDSVLGQNSADIFYIPPYQRGYKWGSANKYEQVPQMLIDIFYAMLSNTEEYYLQYITLKKTKTPKDNKPALEVIDGQQRITTLTIIFYRLAALRCDCNNETTINIAKDLLLYARNQNNTNNKDVFNNIDINNITTLATQDSYYIASAAKTIDSFLHILTCDKKNDEKLLDRYVKYLKNNVKLIVNIESEFVQSEDVFANLNDNKVILTDTDLIKGLLLTKAVSRNNHLGHRRNYREIIDQRVIMGRTWDEINMWVSNQEVAHFFFGKKEQENGMYSLLNFVYDTFFCNYQNQNPSENNLDGNDIVKGFTNNLQPTNVSNNNHKDNFALFNKFNEIISNSEIALKALKHLKHIYLKFRSLYDNYSDCTLYNLLGFVLFAENIDNKKPKVKEVLKSLVSKNEKDFRKYLKEQALNLIPNMNLEKKKFDSDDEYLNNVSKYDYGSNNSNLKNLLLSFSVFPEEEDNHYRFNFYEYDTESWSLEHIYPQHPSSEITIPYIARSAVCAAIETEKNKIEDEERKKSLETTESNIKNDGKLKTDDINCLGFLFYNDNLDFNINVCGNIALLTVGANSALRNNPFIAKRPILMQKIKSGKFVPQHTIRVFNKMYDGFSPDLSSWNKQDVIAHIKWQIKRNKEIRDQLK